MRTLNVQRIQHTTGLASDLAQKNLVLLEGEIIFESDTGKAKLGDGVHTWNELDYWKTDCDYSFASDKDVDDMISDVFDEDSSSGGGGGNVAGDDEIDDMIDDIFGDDTKTYNFTLTGTNDFGSVSKELSITVKG